MCRRRKRKFPRHVSDGSTDKARGAGGQGYRGRTKVDHVADRGRQPCRDHEGPHSGFRLSTLGSRVGRIATEGERIADRDHRAPGILQTSSSEYFRPCGSARKPFEGGFCSRMRRRHLSSDANRQADIQEATMAGNAHEVARLCHVMGSAVAGWSTPSLLPSMTCNAVR